MREKTNSLDSDQVRYKVGCTVTVDGKRLEILDLEVEELYYLCSENKGADQLCSDCEADLHLVFAYADCFPWRRLIFLAFLGFKQS